MELSFLRFVGEHGSYGDLLFGMCRTLGWHEHVVSERRQLFAADYEVNDFLYGEEENHLGNLPISSEQKWFGMCTERNAPRAKVHQKHVVS
ncbi:hypothetical protein EAF04_004180 [Stromatinia cepivora]|nr:hypothetical protein EAF04_004180 [Stromatinia cepivora]